MLKLITTAAVIISGLCLSTSGALASEQRCGWYQNPTPGDWWLTDKDAIWTIESQMQSAGPDAEGIDKIPDPPKGEAVTQPNGHGYSCACMKVDTNAKEKRIIRIYSAKYLPLAQCRKDKSLPKP